MIDIPAVIIHNSIESERKMRTGAEEEYYLMGETGMLEAPADNEAIMKQSLAASFNKPFNYPSHSVLLPDPFLRTHQPYSQITEISPEYNLQKQMHFRTETDSLDIYSDTQKTKYNFSTNCPGLGNNRALMKMNLE